MIMDYLIAFVAAIVIGIVFKLLFYWSEKTSSFLKEDVHYEPPKHEPKQLTEEEEREWMEAFS